MGPKAENEKPEAGAAALRPQKRQAVKQKLDSPFVLKWPAVSSKDSLEILDALRSTVGDVTLQKPPKRKRRRKGTPATDPSAPPPASESDREPDNAPDNTAVLERRKWMREHMCVGVNEVMRAIERRRVRLVVACKEVRPVALVQHIPVAAHAHGLAFCALPDAGPGLGDVLGVRTVGALGFLKPEPGRPPDAGVEALVALIEAKAPPLAVPWIPRGIAAREPAEGPPAPPPAPALEPLAVKPVSHDFNPKGSRKESRPARRHQKEPNPPPLLRQE